MLVRPDVNSATFEVTMPSPVEIRMTRLFDAPPALVFEAMTRPEHVREWWGRLGDGYSVPVCEIDLRVGGRWTFVNRHPKGEATFYGEYLELDPPHRVVFTEVFADVPDSPSTVTAELAAEGARTRLTATVRYESQAVRDMVAGTGMARGAGISYDRLDELVRRLQG
ncbi:MAG: SRPBCC family protein [Vicinamibacterales bacterium]